MEQRVTSINVLDTTTIGRIQISLTHWTDNLEPQISAGSHMEMGGSTFYALANETIDSTAAWGGIAISTLVYIYYGVAGTTATGLLSTTAPTWSTTKQGFYNVAETQRCIGSIYKDAAGNYTQKTLFLDREQGITYQGVNLGIGANADRTLRFDTQGGLTWDTSEGGFLNIQSQKALAGAADVLLKSNLTAGAGTGAAFNIKKPIAGYLNTSAAASYLEMQISGGGGLWLVVATVAGSNAVVNLNPGTYRLRNSGASNTYLFAVGVFGDTTVTAANIVT